MQKTFKLNVYDIVAGIYEKYKSMFRFAVVGCINTGVDFLAFALAHAFLGLDKSISQVAGYSAGILNSFIMNKLWTFENKKSKLGTTNQVIRFVTVNVISLAISLLGLQALNGIYGVNVYVSKLIVTGIAQVVNYTGYKKWVF